MIRIEIKSKEVQAKQITSKKTGELFTVYSQVGWLDKGDEYPVKVEVPLERVHNARGHRDPYEPGFYTLHPDSMQVSRFGSLEIDRYNIQLSLLSPIVLQAMKNQQRPAA